MKRIGLTGGIGSGKSTVSEYLKRLGYPVLDADLVAKEILEPGSPILKQVVDRFGTDVLLPNGQLNRKRLADIAFRDPDERTALNQLTHGEILRILLERSGELKDEPLVFIDAALLFETNLDRSMDEIWVVDCEDEIRIQRVIERDSVSREDVLLRIQSQMSREERLLKTTRVLSNSYDKTELYDQVNAFINIALESETNVF